jgi:hypothetical protein
MIKDEALKMALKALKNGKKVRAGGGGTTVQPVLEDAAINAIKAALAQPEQWVTLTDDEVHALSPFYIEPSTYDLIRAAEAKSKQKNT